MSGRKNTLVNPVFLNHSPMLNQSLSSSFNSDPIVVRYLDNCSFQINVTTVDSQGSFLIEASNDYYVSEPTNVVTNPGNWIPLTLAGGTPAVTAANTNIIINLNQLPFYAIRLSYSSSTAGTGTCAAYMTHKEIG